MTLDEAIAKARMAIEQAHDATVARNYAAMVDDGLDDDMIEAFQKAEADAWPGIRDGALAKLRGQLLRDGETLQ